MISPLNSKLIYPNIKLKHLHHSLPGNSKLFHLVSQSCLTLLQPIDCSPPGSSVHGIPQARILEWVAISFSRGSQPRDWTSTFSTERQILYCWMVQEAHLNFFVVQSLSCVWLFVTPWTAACQVSLSFIISLSLLKCPLSQWCHPTISSSMVEMKSSPLSPLALNLPQHSP